MRTVARVFLLLAVGFAASATRAAGHKFAREVGKVRPKQLVEISGLAASRRNPGVLWLHNDGDAGLLFALDTTGRLVALVKCPAEVEDVEDIALGPGPEAGVDYIYLGDIGDNDQRRRAIRVVRFAEPKLSGKRGEQPIVDAADVFDLVYPNGPLDAETLLVDPLTGDLFVVTKERRRARLFTVSAGRLKPGGEIPLTPLGRVDAEEVSAGDISADGRRIVLRRETRGWLWNRDAGEGLAAALQRTRREIEVRGKRQRNNGEAMAFAPSGDRYFTVSEGKKQPIYEFALPAESSGAR
jgi:hypothetical protein